MSPLRLALLILAVLLFLVAALVPAASQPRISLVPLGLAAFAGAFTAP
jgi:hypothetical protein